MSVWQDDEALFNIIKNELLTALVGDAMDNLGKMHQFLPPNIKPLSPEMVVVGRAMPVLEMDIQVDDPAEIKQPFGIMFEALDDLQRNEVYICSGSSYSYALWGGLMSTRAMYLQAAGAVVNGYSRDTNEILQLGFPTFGMGTYAQDQKPRGQVVDYRTNIDFNGIDVSPGDIIFGDRDGVVIVPKEMEEDVFSKAIEKARDEKRVRKSLRNGKSAQEAYAKYGIM